MLLHCFAFVLVLTLGRIGLYLNVAMDVTLCIVYHDVGIRSQFEELTNCVHGTT